MQPPLKYFVLGVILLASLIGGGVVWLGPNLVGLAFMADGSDEPYLVLDFNEGRRSYETMVATGQEEWDFESLASYSLAYVAEGHVADEWPRLDILRFTQANAVVQFVTSARYRDYKLQESDFAALKLGSHVVPKVNLQNTLILWLVEEVADQPHAMAAIQAGLPLNVSVLWNGGLAAVETPALGVGAQWQSGLLLGFNTYAEAMAYLRSGDTQSQRKVARSRARALMLAVYRRKRS